MRLPDYLAKHGRGTKAKLARALHVRWATVHDIAGGHIPKADLAKRIETATNGEVTAAEVLGLDTPPTLATDREDASPPALNSTESTESAA